MVDDSNLTNAIVLDASAFINYLLPDEEINPTVAEWFHRFETGQCDIHTPQLFMYEITNALRSGVLKHRLTKETATDILHHVISLNFVTHPSDPAPTLALALKHQLSAYDAAYLALASKLDLPLVSLDQKLVTISVETNSLNH